MIATRHNAEAALQRLRQRAARQAEARLAIRELRRRKAAWWRAAERLWPGFGAD